MKNFNSGVVSIILLVVILIVAVAAESVLLNSFHTPSVSSPTSNKTVSNNTVQQQPYTNAPVITGSGPQIIGPGPTYSPSPSYYYSPAPIYNNYSAPTYVQNGPTEIPTITSINPDGGTAGTLVTLYGSGLQNGTVLIYERTSIITGLATIPNDADTLIYSSYIYNAQNNQLTFTMPTVTHHESSCDSSAGFCSNLIIGGTDIFIKVQNQSGTSNQVEFMYNF